MFYRKEYEKKVQEVLRKREGQKSHLSYGKGKGEGFLRIIA
ncbi:hypothetical protein SAMN02745243_00275 [Hespellia stercorisuis DSM 15480]|uniref:Uncharacterized protein n=1 Tax=Hespellia stercorisuis DSM 15480 TaxID=1121950 RepID=A0A1M6I8T6_9FIRM|nr:hypothetical protein SAMN02745243_00275 [Hespellia stercorisuis DSM 15480]